MKILLLQPPWSNIYGRFKSAAKLGCVAAPLGLCYLAAMLKKQDWEVKILDAEVLKLSLNDIINYIKDFSPDIIGITVTTPIYDKVKYIAREIKYKTGIPIVVGGVHPTIVQEEVLSDCPYIDYVVFGEGENTLVELIKSINSSNLLNNISGLIWRKGQNIIKNEPRPYIQDLDAIPFPRRDLLQLELYRHSLPDKGIVQYADLFTGRGCPYKCIFCSQHTMYGRKVRYRSIQNVIEELDIIVNRQNIKHIIIMDETLTLNKNRIELFCDEIEKNKLSFTWEGWTHAATVDAEILKRMASVGMIKISFGIESGNQSILDSIKKNVTLAQIEEAYKYAKQAGLETRGSVMLGHPFETKKTIKDTIDFVCSLKNCDQIFMAIATPYPGTELWDCAINGIGGMELLTKDFSKYQRYGNPVIRVNDLNPEDLIKFQRYGLFRFYSNPRKFFYNLKRAGLYTGLKNSLVFAKSLLS